jgi:hypothetical protein
MSRPEGAPAAAALDGGAPAPGFTVLGAHHDPRAASPTMVLSVGVEEPAGREVYTIALSTQVHIDPARREYDAATRAALADLFGAPERWAATTHSFLWRRVDLLVPSFTGSAVFELPIPCDYDLEVAATKYVYALPDGEMPISLHFSGTVFYPAPDGRMQLVQIGWDSSASHRLPVAAWRAMIAHHYPHSGWVRLHADTLAALRARAAANGDPTLDACVLDLLREGDA